MVIGIVRKTIIGVMKTFNKVKINAIHNAVQNDLTLTPGKIYAESITARAEITNLIIKSIIIFF